MLGYLERPADGAVRGLLVLHHGRGADEQDLLPLAEVLDPDRAWHVVSPQAPLTVPGWPGRHWYHVPHVGYPDPDTFRGSVDALAELHDHLWSQTGVGADRTVLGGFSMGTVMSYAMGLSADRPAPAGILALSGFVPTVDGWAPSLEDRLGLQAFIAHGRQDGTIPIEFARQAHDLLASGGLDVEYHEFDGGHNVEMSYVRPLMRWLERTVPERPAAGD